MKITVIDLFYISLPVIREIADGSQDSLLCRVTADNGLQGWGEADSSPLVSIAVYVMPMSHSNIVSIKRALIGQEVNTAEDVRKLRDRAARMAMDVEQFNHAYPAVDIALWDLLGKHLKQPVYKLLGYERAYEKIAYASVLFGNTPQETEDVARKLASQGFKAAKFGWGPFGSSTLDFDVQLVKAARRGLGPDAMLFVDAGVIFGKDVAKAHERMKAIASENVGWFEEPFRTYEVDAYRQLKELHPPIKIAAGEGAASLHAGMEMMVRGKLDFIQIDVGRIGGITVADSICKAAHEHKCHYVNHTYKSQLLLAASLHVLAGVKEFNILEYAAGESVLITGVTSPTGVKVDAKGMCHASEAPGLGVEVNLDFVRKHLKQVHIQVDGQTLYETPKL